jgi:hypothetical protein
MGAAGQVVQPDIGTGLRIAAIERHGLAIRGDRRRAYFARVADGSQRLAGPGPTR